MIIIFITNLTFSSNTTWRLSGNTHFLSLDGLLSQKWTANCLFGSDRVTCMQVLIVVSDTLEHSLTRTSSRPLWATISWISPSSVMLSNDVNDTDRSLAKSSRCWTLVSVIWDEFPIILHYFIIRMHFRRTECSVNSLIAILVLMRIFIIFVNKIHFWHIMWWNA